MPTNTLQKYQSYPRIAVSPDTYAILKGIGRMGDSFDDVLKSMLVKLGYEVKESEK